MNINLEFSGVNSSLMTADFSGTEQRNVNYYCSVPFGVALPYMGTTAPNGFAICQGQAVSKSLYPDLFSIIRYTFGGSGDTFYLPDLRGKVFAGYKSGHAIFGTFGSTVGEDKHTLTVDELPKFKPSIPGAFSASSGSGDKYTVNGYPVTDKAGQYNLSGSEIGGGLPHNNVQTSLVGNWIIRLTSSTEDWNNLISQTYDGTSALAMSGVAIAGALILKENTSNKVTSLSAESTNTQYPSAKCVYDELRNFAGALHGNKSGTTVVVDDVSDIQHNLNVSVVSLNKWDITPYYIVTGDGTVKTVCLTTNISCGGKDLTFACTVSKTNVVSTDVGNLVYLNVTFADGFVYNFPVVRDDTANGTIATVLPTALHGNITTIVMYQHSRFTSGSITVSNIQLCKGDFTVSTKPPYSKHISNLALVSISRNGKNLFDKSTMIKSGVYLSSSGVYTTTSSTEKTILMKIPHNCIITISKLKTSIFHVATYDNMPVNGTTPKTFSNVNAAQYTDYTLANVDANYLAVFFYNSSGETANYDDVINSTQVELNDIVTSYEPFKAVQTVTASADGTVIGLTSIAPNMTLLSNDSGAVINLDYNRDINMAEQKLIARIEALENIQ